MIDLRFDFGTSLNRLIDTRAVDAAEAQALNRTRNNVQTAGLKEVSRAMGIKPAKLKKRGFPAGGKRGKFGVVARGRRAIRAHLETAVIGRGRPFNVSRWGGKAAKREGRRVVATAHSAYGVQRVIGSTWILKNGAIVTRSGNSFRSVFGPGVTQMMFRPDVLEIMQQVAFDKFPGHFSSAIDYYMARRGRRRGR